jgi:hypothetical protein
LKWVVQRDYQSAERKAAKKGATKVVYLGSWWVWKRAA